MAIKAYLSMKGQRQGQIKGGVTEPGRLDEIAVYDLAYSLVSPRDSATGLPTGKRLHHPVQITCPTGLQTPKVFQAAATNENLTEFKIDFWLPNRNGISTNAFRLELTNGSVAEFDLNLEQEGGVEELLDQYSFTFQKIALTWLSGGISATDDWVSPTA
ncbi:MAG TPA: type VI secretion system tube protein TssD [Gaiellaceae bacterium]|jgi:type VI secretion system secreted protein Hcp